MKKKREKMLFLGRFQPFHKGHLAVVKKYLKHYDVIIGLGGPKKSGAHSNPFTANERKDMIRNSLTSLGVKRVKICSIPDIPDDKKYVRHVEKIVRSKFHVVFSGNPWVYGLFKEKGYQIRVINEQKERIGGISATKIREAICEDKNWEKFVPDSVVAYIKRIRGISRIKKLTKKR